MPVTRTMIRVLLFGLVAVRHAGTQEDECQYVMELEVTGATVSQSCNQWLVAHVIHILT